MNTDDSKPGWEGRSIGWWNAIHQAESCDVPGESGELQHEKQPATEEERLLACECAAILSRIAVDLAEVAAGQRLVSKAQVDTLRKLKASASFWSR